MLVFLINLAAAVALLLWSVRMIRTGVERAFLNDLRAALAALSKSRVGLAGGGCMAAMTLQSATAVALIASGFVVSGLLSSQAALAMFLGAELGSAIMALVLTLPLQNVVSILLLVGVVSFLKAGTRRVKQFGRILIGFAMVLISLRFLGDATQTISASPIVASIAAYLEKDLITVFVLGALFAWMMHSSLAAVMTFAAFTAAGLVPVSVGQVLVVGANFGGAFVALGLLWSSDNAVRVVALANMLGRGALALALLSYLTVNVIDLSPWFSSVALQIIALHILMNAVLLTVSLPLAPVLIRAAQHLLPAEKTAPKHTISALDESTLTDPNAALACAQREILRMAETVQSMLAPSIRLIREWDGDLAELIAEREDDIDRMHFETKIFASKLMQTDLPKAQKAELMNVVSIANGLESAADRIAVNLSDLAKKMHQDSVSFSETGLSDLHEFHAQITANGQLALRVLTTGDAEAARQLVSEKERVREEEKRLQTRHMKRLQAGTPESIASSNAHQEVLQLLKQVNASLCFVAYPIAAGTGDLLKSRLVPQ